MAEADVSPAAASAYARRMGRPHRIEIPGGYYHVHTRGNDRQPISFGNWSGRLFVRELARATRRYNWRILSWCLMTNHYHLVLQIGEAGLSDGMRELNGRYATESNRINKRRDHLFGSRFKSHLIEQDGHLLESCRYTLLNPVRAHAVRAPVHWRSSSMRTMAGLEPTPPWLDVDWILSHFGASAETARRIFLRFVADGIGEPPPPVPGTVPVARGRPPSRG
jgi:putative transposase